MEKNGSNRDNRPLSVMIPMPPSYRGGTEEYAYRLVEGFSRLAPTRAMTTNVRWDTRAEKLDTGSALVVRFPAHEVYERPLLTSSSARRRIWQQIRQSRILNLHMPFPFVEATAARVAHQTKIPVVLTYHMDADLRAARDSPIAGWITRMYRQRSAHPALDECDVVVSNSLGYARASPILASHLDRVKVIPKGVDPVRLRIGGAQRAVTIPASARIDRIPPANKRILFVGRLVPYKGVSVLLESFAQLRHRRSDVELLIAGRGPLLTALQVKAKACGVDEHVQFLGFVPDSELGDLYRFADVVVVPSIGALESTSTVLEEAAACGAPIVGSDLPGASESLPNDGTRGRLVPPGDIHALTEAIDRMVGVTRPSPPSVVRTWNDVVSEYVDLFSRLGVILSTDRNSTSMVDGSRGLAPRNTDP
jgi:glycosyltransferase involved in cell wall biosynthesis